MICLIHLSNFSSGGTSTSGGASRGAGAGWASDVLRLFVNILGHVADLHLAAGVVRVLHVNALVRQGENAASGREWDFLHD